MSLIGLLSTSTTSYGLLEHLWNAWPYLKRAKSINMFIQEKELTAPLLLSSPPISLSLLVSTVI